MTQERFSNLTALNRHKERTAKFAPPTPRLRIDIITFPFHFARRNVGRSVLVLKTYFYSSFTHVALFSVVSLCFTFICK